MKNNTEVYESQIAPLLKKILNICKDNDIQIYYALNSRSVDELHFEIADGYNISENQNADFITAMIEKTKSYPKSKEVKKDQFGEPESSDKMFNCDICKYRYTDTQNKPCVDCHGTYLYYKK